MFQFQLTKNSWDQLNLLANFLKFKNPTASVVLKKNIPIKTVFKKNDEILKQSVFNFSPKQK